MNFPPALAKLAAFTLVPLALAGCVSKTYDWVRVPNPMLAQAPAPVQPLPPPVKNVTLKADGLFRFAGGEQEDLLPQGRQQIEELIAELRRDVKTIQSIAITGHTDRIGSSQANEALSMQRARTVREMFVRGGIDEGLVRAEGMGENYPVVYCDGMHPTPELVDCLQPNRRVEIRVVGLR
jgi:outer membrane protein OmpA-like peptidoglycan-associated protein